MPHHVTPFSSAISLSLQIEAFYKRRTELRAFIEISVAVGCYEVRCPHTKKTFAIDIYSFYLHARTHHPRTYHHLYITTCREHLPEWLLPVRAPTCHHLRVISLDQVVSIYFPLNTDGKGGCKSLAQVMVKYRNWRAQRTLVVQQLLAGFRCIFSVW